MNSKLSRTSGFRGSVHTRKRAALLGFLLFSLGFPPCAFLARAVDVFGPACGSAVIDGIVDPGEWARAATKTFPMLDNANNPVFEATLRVMNDGKYLSMGLTINDDEFTTFAQTLPLGDGFRIDFDNNHSGFIFTVGDDVLLINAGAPQFQDNYILVNTSSPSDISGGGTIDGSGAASRLNGLNHFELKHPLCSGDIRDFCLHPGDVVGFRLEYLDATAQGIMGGASFYPGSQTTSLADIVVAECSLIYLPLISK